MPTYDSVHTGEQVDNAVDIVLANKSKGDSTTPVYLDANGNAVSITKATAPASGDNKLITSGAAYTALDTKFDKANVSNTVPLTTSTTTVPTSNAAKTYIDNQVATKQDPVIAGTGISISGNTISVDTTGTDVLTIGDLDNKWNHFGNLDVGTGEDLVEKMNEAKHSTFDASKFTKVGSPIVTSDGIASGFSSSNDLLTTYTFNPSGTWEIKGTFTTPITAPSVDATILAVSDATYRTRIILNAGMHFGWKLSSNNTSYDINNQTGSQILQVNTKYYFKWSFDGSQYLLKVSTDGVNWQTSASATSSDKIYTTSSSKLRLGKSNDSYEIFNGSIDLKQFSITVDGVEVFSGNKTGIDTIKPDDYTVVGSPTITSDGIASGFSSGNHIDLPSPFNPGNSAWSIIIPIKTSSTFAASQTPMTLFRAFNAQINVSIGSGGLLECKLNDSSTNFVTLDIGSERLSTLTSYLIKVEFTKTAYNLYVNGILKDTENSTTVINTSTGNTIGSTGSGSYAFNGSIDLNAFKVYVDGDLVYQPCLKIPYTQTSDGKKIVDSYYKDRVEDEYTQASYTPYYTLQSANKGNYGVVGSPTISSDFVVSGFSSGNYIQTSEITVGQKDFEIITKFKLNSQAQACLFSGQGSQKFQFYIQNNSAMTFDIGNGSSWISAGNSTTFTPSVNVDYWLKFKFVYNSGYFVYYSTDGINYTQCGSYSTTTYLSNFKVNIGTNRGADAAFLSNGSIDLNSFKIYVDNKLAYQAVVPPNYTMATVKPTQIIDSYNNGISSWTKQADLTLKQTGSCTSGTAVTLPKPFRDTNYALSVPYSAKTATGFTPTQTGDWIAKGKANLI